MSMRFIKTALILASTSLVLSNCSKPVRSQKTGMAYNDRNNGGYVRFRQTHPAPGPGLVAIEGGTFVLGGSAEQDVTYDYNNTRRRVTVASFYMDESEVSNQDWLDYLHWISITFPQDRELYYNATPDTLVWRRPLSYNEPYVSSYLRHPAFQDYPVVGVSWEQAQEYCVWRTDRMNENILREGGQMASWKEASGNGGRTTAAAGGTAGAGSTGISSTPFNTDIYLNGQIRGTGADGRKMPKDLNPAAGGNARSVRPVRIEDGILKPSYRLPSEAEWEYAALGLAGNTQFENIEEGKIYPWNGMGVRSPKARTRGLIMANFKRGEGDNMGVGGGLNDKADITAPVRSYQPNDFGLYNMAGNVNEWTGDTYRQMSFEDVEDFNPFRGNEFTNKKLADPAKGIYAKDKYGRPIKEAAKSDRKLPYAEFLAQQQQTSAGTPPASTTAPGTNAPAGTTTPAVNPIAGKPYKADQRGFADSVETSLYGVTTLVNDHSKVYKGGSWNDRAVWLNPAMRRFMDQADASAEVGFRCAMNMVGAPEINPNGKSHFGVKKPKNYNPKGR